MKKSRKQKRADMNKAMIISVILIIILIPALVLSVNSYMRKADLEDKIELLHQQIEQANLQKALYEEEISKIGTPQHYEYLARKLLGYIYEGETVLILPEK
ncbi:MAG: hypothetical protein E7218_04920 [Anaerofustis stercorihominis]|nr:hypothetical protein [Anaerofustis stercorihominis]